jgi:hypothetical protein
MRSKINLRLIGAAWFIFVLIFVSGMVAVAFFIKSYLFKIL